MAAPAVTLPGGAYVPHPLAESWRMLEGVEFEALVDDIRQYGVRQPVVMLDGMVLDGRNRYLAAREAGVSIPTVVLDGGDDPAAFVKSLNYYRRHDSESARSMASAKLANLGEGRPSKTSPIEPVSQEDAARLMNVSVASVKRATTVLERGTPALVAAVEAGEVSVSAAAEVARLPETLQVEIVEEGPAAVREAAKEIRETGHVNRTSFTGNNEWFTPAEHVARARACLGEIDLDPASHELAQATVAAGNYFTEEDDGLAHDWNGRIWLNPPYAQPAIGQFVDKMVAEVAAGRVTEAVMLTHNYTDTAWFQKAAAACRAICFTRGRVRFVSPSGDVAAPTQGQAFFYFGDRLHAFLGAFAEVGFVVEVRR